MAGTDGHRSAMPDRVHGGADADLQEKKRQFRRLMRGQLKSLDPEYIEKAGADIREQILRSDRYRSAESIFLYISTPLEPSTAAILEDSLRSGKRVYVPKCTAEHEMLAVRLRHTDELVPGAYGLMEPKENAETAEADELDLILVPCISASPDGRRLGHGGGYYDRFLQDASAKAVCLCFRRMLSADIPVTEKDVPIPSIISDRMVGSW